jgi:hypothetical protein
MSLRNINIGKVKKIGKNPPDCRNEGWRMAALTLQSPDSVAAAGPRAGDGWVTSSW